MSTHTGEVLFARRKRGLENAMCAREGHVHVRRIDFNGSYKRLKPEDSIVVQYGNTFPGGVFLRPKINGMYTL